VDDELDEPRGVGRPSAYQDGYANQARKLCEMGATDIELADFFEVAVSTIYLWKHTHLEFSEAVRAGKDACDDRVERAFYNRAVGYTHDAVKIFMPANAAAPVYAPYREHVPPDPGAALNWLKNRRPDKWRDKTEVEVIDRASVIAEARKRAADRGNGA
jgi:hypothetical protein